MSKPTKRIHEPAERQQPENMLGVDHLSYRYPHASGDALTDVSFTLSERENLGIVGGSGSGKTTLSRLLLALLQPTSGNIVVYGSELAAPMGLRGRSFRQWLQPVFQDPYSSLDPRMRVSDIIREPLRYLSPAPGNGNDRVRELLHAVDLDPSLSLRYPHQLSGGQRQRVAIARALAPKPSVILADEPVSALDMSIRAGIITLLDRLCHDTGLTLIVISHDLGIVEALCQTTLVLHEGHAVEYGPTRQVLSHPDNSYTRTLLDSVLRLPPRGKGFDGRGRNAEGRDDHA